MEVVPSKKPCGETRVSRITSPLSPRTSISGIIMDLDQQLRELVLAWRAKYLAPGRHLPEYEHGIEVGRRMCADDLTAIIDDIPGE